MSQPPRRRGRPPIYLDPSLFLPQNHTKQRDPNVGIAGERRVEGGEDRGGSGGVRHVHWVCGEPVVGGL